jgi:hypothetical protein
MFFNRIFTVKTPSIYHNPVRALEKAGFSVVRQSGHIVMGNGERRLLASCHLHG